MYRYSQFPFYPSDADDSGIFLTSDDHDHPIDEEPPSCPPAPKLKDMDSFTDGTGAGSFDYTLYSQGSESLSDVGVGITQPHSHSNPTELSVNVGAIGEVYIGGSSPTGSVAFSPEAPVRSIEVWIDDVQTSHPVVAHPHPPPLPHHHHYDYPIDEYEYPPRGVKRHLSWTSDLDPSREDRIRARWETYTKPFSEPDADRGYSIWGEDDIINPDEVEVEGVEYGYVYGMGEEEMIDDSDDVVLPIGYTHTHTLTPPRPASAPPS